MNRRAALRLAAGGLAAGTAVRSLPPRPSVAAPSPFNMAEVAPGIFVRRGVDEDATATNDDAIANIGFIVGDEAVAVIDPGGSRTDGERLLATIRATTERPIRYVILSHVHPDHIFGCGAFRDLGATFIGHARLHDVLMERGEYYRNRLADILGFDEAGAYVMPKRIVETIARFDLGDRALELRAHKTAHTDNDLSVFDQHTATLWAADLLFVERIPSLDGSLTGWLSELDVLRALPATQAVPGHGPTSVVWPAGADDEIRYLSTLAREIRAIIAGGGDIETAVETVGQSERSRWTLFDDYNGHNVTVAFKELEWE
jgi:quinoprotein relay system zinc metallohydrolase 2